MVSPRMTAPLSISSSGRLALLERVGPRDVSAYITVVEDHPARHRLVGVHRLADLDVGVRLVAESSAGSRRRRWRPGRCRPLPSAAAASPPLAMKTEGSHQASSSRSVFAPRRIAVCSTSPVSPALAIDHWPRWAGRRCIGDACPRCGRSRRRPAARPCAPRRSARAITSDARADDAAVLDDQILHRGVGPDRRLAAQVDQRLEHLTDQ